MLGERMPLAELCPGLETEAVLTAYCRGRTGLLADDGARWAVLILPGGGYECIAPAEGEPVALAFAAAGVQAFVLSYSVLPARWPRQFLEGAAALAWLRSRAGTYGFRPDRVAVCGFSAGGAPGGVPVLPVGSPYIKGGAGPGPGAGAARRVHPVLPGGERGALPLPPGRRGGAAAGSAGAARPPPRLSVGHGGGCHGAGGEHPGLRPGAAGKTGCPSSCTSSRTGPTPWGWPTGRAPGTRPTTTPTRRPGWPCWRGLAERTELTWSRRWC